MNVTCDRAKLAEGLAIANTVVPTKSTKPVLENVCLVATDHALELIGTDLEVSVRYRIDDVQVDEPGPAVIPAKVTLDFVRDLSGEKVTLSTEDQTCRIQSDDDSCELVTIDPDEFPVVSRFGDNAHISLQGGNFTRLVSQTAFAAAREPGRYAMHGVQTRLEDDKLTMVATDGRRLALASLPADGSNGEVQPVIIPTKGLQLFCRVIDDPLNQIQLSFAENQVGLQSRNAEIFARLIDGEFPHYQAVIPADTANAIEAPLSVFSQKLRLVSNVSGEETRAVRLNFSKDRLELLGRSVGRGSAKAYMDVSFAGDAAEIAFNPDYVLEGIKRCETDQVRLEFDERTSPGKFCLGEEFFYVVMPITVDTLGENGA